jgi:hypothetical protein
MVSLLLPLRSDAAPALHALTLSVSEVEDGFGNGFPEHEFQRLWAPLRDTHLHAWASLRYLRVFAIHLPFHFELSLHSALLKDLPPRLELLQITSPSFPAKGIQLLADSTALPATLRHVLLCPINLHALSTAPVRDPRPWVRQSRVHERVLMHTDMDHLRALEQLASRAPQLDSVAWMHPINAEVAVREAEEVAKKQTSAPPPPLPVIRSMTRVLLMSLNHLLDPSTTLSLFPALTELRIGEVQPLGYHAAAAGELVASSAPLLVQWPQATRSSLRELRVLNLHYDPRQQERQQDSECCAQQALLNQLAAAQLHALERLSLSGEDALQPCTGPVRNAGMAACVDLAPLFSSMPLLSFVSLRAFAFVDFSAFKLLPNLTALREITWPKTAVLHRLPPIHLAECLPSLTALHVRFGESPSAYPWRILLSSLPALRSVSWRREKACPPEQIEANYLAQVEARAQVSKAAGAEADVAFARTRAMYEDNMAPLPSKPTPSSTAAAQDGAAVGVEVRESMGATSVRLRREWEPQQRALGRSTAVPDLASLSLTAQPDPTVVSSSDAAAAIPVQSVPSFCARVHSQQQFKPHSPCWRKQQIEESHERR